MILSIKNTVLLLISLVLFTNCQAQNIEIEEVSNLETTSIKPIVTGAEKVVKQNDLLQDKNVALLVNQTSMVGSTHIVDALLEQKILVKKIFAPEHGFRGNADAGEKIVDGFDSKTNLPIISLYGSHKKPTPEDLAGIDVVVFDIQDVGARFYTYISTMHYLMEACAENKVDLIVLDRPNPNGHIVDGPVLDLEFQSFVGMHAIPVLHGMTVGEYAQMINGEGWLNKGLTCNLQVITCENYSHLTPYSLPVKPSPNLPNDRAIELYPSTCFFEGTVISEGRGTDFPFQVFGAPNIDEKRTTYTYTPVSKEGAKYPKFENKTCYGFNVSNPENDFKEQKGINLNYLVRMYNLYPDKANFFLKNGFFDKLAGGTQLRKDIIAGKSVDQIKNSWQQDIEDFKSLRTGYLLYEDFE